MLFYVLLLSMVLVLTILQQQTDTLLQKNSAQSIKSHTGKTPWFYIIACGFLLFFLMFRKETAFSDLDNYATQFHHITARSWEPGYMTLNYLVSILTSSFNVFLMVCAILSMVPMLYVLYKETNKYLWLAVLIFFSGPFMESFSALRICIAYAFLYMAYHLLDTEQKKSAYICMFLAVTFHYTAILLVLALIILNRKYNFYWFMMACILSLSFPFLGELLKLLVIKFIPRYQGYLNFEGSLAFTNLVLFGVLTFLGYLYYDKLLEENHKNVFLVNLSAAMLIFNLTCTWFPVFGRIVDMCKIFQVFFIPRLIACESNKAIRCVYLVFFGLLYLLFVYKGIATKNFSYLFCWQG